MTTKNTLIISLILILIGTLAGVFLWDRLPVMVASHWGADDQVNGYMPRFWGVALMPMVTIGMLILFLLLPSMDPLKANVEQFRDTFNSFITLIIGFMIYIHFLTLLWNIGYTNFRISSAMLPAMGLLFIFTGGLIKKAKRNFFIGIRTPWTLSSDRVWDKTHQVGGRLFSAAGFIALLGAFFPNYSIWLVLVPVTGVSLFSVIYSYYLFRSDEK